MLKFKEKHEFGQWINILIWNFIINFLPGENEKIDNFLEILNWKDCDLIKNFEEKSSQDEIKKYPKIDNFLKTFRSILNSDKSDDILIWSIDFILNQKDEIFDEMNKKILWNGAGDNLSEEIIDAEIIEINTNKEKILNQNNFEYIFNEMWEKIDLVNQIADLQEENLEKDEKNKGLLKRVKQLNKKINILSLKSIEISRKNSKLSLDNGILQKWLKQRKKKLELINEELDEIYLKLSWKDKELAQNWLDVITLIKQRIDDLIYENEKIKNENEELKVENNVLKNEQKQVADIIQKLVNDKLERERKIKEKELELDKTLKNSFLEKVKAETLEIINNYKN